MKTLLVIAFILTNASSDPIKMLDYGYFPSFEECTKEGFSFIRNEIAKVDVVKLDVMYCMELNEEEAASDEAAVNGAKKLYFLGTK